MDCTIVQKEIEEIKPSNILSQTPFWGRLKDKQGFQPKGFEISVSKDTLFSHGDVQGNESDDLLVLIKYIDATHCFAYVPYGPELEPEFENQGVFLEQLSETIKPYLPRNCIFIRYDLAWQNQWSADDDYFDAHGNWTGPPDEQVQEFRVNYKTINWRLKKSPSDILPKNTFFLDLTQQEDTLLSNMRYNTRYNVKRALNQGIRVQEYGIEHISEWYRLYYDTAVRHNLPLQNEQYFLSILKKQDNNKKGVKVKMLMADWEGEFMASMFLALSHKRGTYLYGASATNKQNIMASYALQWESIKMAKNWGCSEYDMFGSAPNINQSHPLHGIHIYKKGFGGNLYHRMGCWDYPYSQKHYDLFIVQELCN
ncbi:peptidoglycan bridge formation glycyltransferase FemA/FemB family protein [Maribellus luteus]|uniref:Peptidoglycan bridge formation glycyltransferase FemA/FemB family protein n=1 Tax=Maribellus luteus TaxID=2305463 RepID=A0A399SSY9_9BACT|nr:peptidoglycan bridge formation glycyltransferase FemA/FemB family protein [Maribellus luteus]RIJ46009.1 peptidoglycan bridge formation glycyltransferase FemA/FemB family protein [Maribellus luteus]